MDFVQHNQLNVLKYSNMPTIRLEETKLRKKCLDVEEYKKA